MSKKTFTAMDGNEAAAYVAYAFSEVAAIYPITPSSPMAEKTDLWAAQGRKNIYGQQVTLVEMQSEAGAIGAVHGAAQTGALACSYTSSQGLMLMIPVMHRIAGERLPAVLHVASRTVGTHALSIFGDHSDVMNCRQTGFGMLATASIQEIMDLAPVAHLAALKGRIPMLHFFDGFRTSHEIDKIEQISYDEFASLRDDEALRAFRERALNPEHPLLRATVQNPDVYFQVREANNVDYAQLPAIVQGYMDRVHELTGRPYHLVDYTGAPDAERVVIAMGSVCSTAKGVAAALCAAGEKVGFLQVRLYRPFPAEQLLTALPETAKKVAVLDRCKEMGAMGEPLYQDVCCAVAQSGRAVTVVGGRYGLSSKDTDEGQLKGVYDELQKERPKNSFTIGITDDVTHLSLPSDPAFLPKREGEVACKFWGLGSDGTVGANKNTVHIIAEHTPLYAQAYFEYDAKKSYGLTRSHLRFGPNPIESATLVKQADFVACHNPSFLTQYEMLSELKPGGTFLLNCPWSPEELEEKLPANVKRQLACNQAKFYLIDAAGIAQKLGLGNHYNAVLQSAFFRLCGVIPYEQASAYLKEAVKKTYFAKGEQVVSRNCAAIDAGGEALVAINVPACWAGAQEEPKTPAQEPEVVRNILRPLNAQRGDDLPVSTFLPYQDGAIEMGLTAYEKRGIALQVPKWNAEVCTQCNRCSFVCPHAVLRPYLLEEEQAKNAPDGFHSVPAKGKRASGLFYSLQVSEADCTGCGSCVACCPLTGKALAMVPVEEAPFDAACWSYGLNLPQREDQFDPYTVKGSQFRRPLLEFSAACAGCGETPYAKLLTQLYGDRVYWANATGCSQAWGSPMPGIPYTVNQRGFGPAWSNSLFENNAEFSLGMFLSVQKQREAQQMRARQLLELEPSAEVQAALQEWLATFDDLDASRGASDRLVAVLTAAQLSEEQRNLAERMLQNKDQLAKKTFWMFGGDGWAYDIGYGGLDHVVASGADVNVLVVDTEVYSNTGGQSSKATPLGAVAQFCAAGKPIGKKDLGALMMTYGNVYVAQVAMGASFDQLLTAIKEAQSYPGPSVIVAYTPCTAHGIRRGMDNVQQEMAQAVKAGYWHLYRFDPRKEKPFTLDSKEPSDDFTEFLRGEVRYSALDRTFPQRAQQLFAKSDKQAKEKYEKYRRMQE